MLPGVADGNSFLEDMLRYFPRALKFNIIFV